MENRRNFLFKSTASLVLLTFTTLQIAWADGSLLPVESPGDNAAEIEAGPHVLDPVSEAPTPQNSDEFLLYNFPLSRAEGNAAEKTAEAAARQHSESYSVAEALELLRPEFAAAAILANPS